MRSLNDNVASMSREIAVIAARCDMVRFPNSGMECRRAVYGAATSTGRHYHDDANVVFTLSGLLTQTMGPQATVLTPHSLMYVPAGEIHATTFGPHGAHCFFVGIDAMWMERRLDSAKIDGTRPRISTGSSDLQAFALKMYQEFRDPDSLSEMIVEGAFLGLLGIWFRERSERHQCAPGWLRSVKILLHDSFRESISLTDVSQAVGVHSCHIAREFHHAYSVTVGEYIRKLRVDFVAERLRYPGKNTEALTDLALQAGFSSHAHMSSVFRKMTGMTPSQYKKTYGITSTW
jgi:AraC family transcriptional regulator